MQSMRFLKAIRYESSLKINFSYFVRILACRFDIHGFKKTFSSTTDKYVMDFTFHIGWQVHNCGLQD